MMQDVKFPMALDVFDLCSPELQQKLIPMRDRFKEEDDKRLEEAQVGCLFLLNISCLFANISCHIVFLLLFTE